MTADCRSEPAASSCEPDSVSAEELAHFKCTLLARRFPGLKGLSEEDIRCLILADRKATGRKDTAPRKLYPKSEPGAVTPIRELPQPASHVFIPANTAEAKDTVKRSNDEFLCLGSPYDAHDASFSRDKSSDRSKCPVGIDSTFKPTSASVAKSTISVCYYLNSGDADGIAAERNSVHDRSTRNLSSFYAAYSDRRGKMLV